jgi:hypothetical protein
VDVVIVVVIVVKIANLADLGRTTFEPIVIFSEANVTPTVPYRR